MTSINLSLQKMSFSLGEGLDEETITPRQTLSFQVWPDGHETINISTDEVFIAPRYGRILTEQKTAIIGYFQVIRSLTHDKDTLGMMRYSSSYDGGVDYAGGDASINFHYLMRADSFDTLLANIRSGLRPTTASVDFGFSLGDDPSEAFEFDWAPDGSEKKWDVTDKKNRVQRIESVTFTYRDPIQEDADNEDAFTPASFVATKTTIAERRAAERKLIPWYERPLSFHDPIQVLIGVVLVGLGLLWHYS